MNRSNQMHLLTYDDQKQITDLATIGYSEEQTMYAYFACGKDFDKAAAKLLNDHTFDKHFIQSY